MGPEPSPEQALLRATEGLVGRLHHQPTPRERLDKSMGEFHIEGRDAVPSVRGGALIGRIDHRQHLRSQICRAAGDLRPRAEATCGLHACEVVVKRRPARCMHVRMCPPAG